MLAGTHRGDSTGHCDGLTECKGTRGCGQGPVPHHKHPVLGGDHEDSILKASSPCLPTVGRGPAGQLPMEGASHRGGS